MKDSYIRKQIKEIWHKIDHHRDYEDENAIKDILDVLNDIVDKIE